MERRRSLITQPVTFFMCVASHADTPTAAGMTGLCRPDKVDINTGLLKVWLSPGLLSETMAEINERPIILPYSNPTSRRVIWRQAEVTCPPQVGGARSTRHAT